jgi:hypothetical protein
MRRETTKARFGGGFCVVCAALAAVFGGCRGDDPLISDGLDTKFFVSGLPDGRPALVVTFARYNILESDIIEEAWTAAAPPQEADENTSVSEKSASIGALWEANSLRIACVTGETAAKVRRTLRSASTFRGTRTQVMMPSQTTFDLHLGRRQASGGVIYETSKTKAFKDVTNLQLVASCMIIGRSNARKLSLTPLLVEGDASLAVLDGLTELFPIEENMLILIGPVSKPAEKSLGALLTGDADFADAQLVAIETRQTK